MIDWFDVVRIFVDVFECFLYDEYFYNVVFLLCIVEEFGFSEDYVFKEMVDCVVFDFGVFKIYLRVDVNGWVLCFLNGMFVNERYGCLLNWMCLGFDELFDDEWVMIVVNNCVDCILRLKVFVKIFVEDLSVDLYVLIGGNFMGLFGYIEEVFDEWFV